MTSGAKLGNRLLPVDIIMKNSIFLLKSLSSVALIIFLLSRIDLSTLSEAFINVRWSFIFAATLAFCLQPLVSAKRWNLILAMLHRPLPFSRVMRFYWISIFLNQFLPASIGGDAVRAWLVHRTGYEPKANLAALILDRLVMTVVLLLLVSISQPFVLTALRLSAALTDPYFLALASVAMVLAVFFLWIFRKRLFGLSIVRRFTARLCEGPALRWTPRDAVLISIATLGSYLPFAFALWLICAALSLPIDLWQAALLTPAVILSATLPISIGGWGVREGAVAGLLMLNGIAVGTAVPVALIFGIGSLASCLPGGVVLLLGRRSGSKPLWREAGELRADLPESSQ